MVMTVYFILAASLSFFELRSPAFSTHSMRDIIVTFFQKVFIGCVPKILMCYFKVLCGHGGRLFKSENKRHYSPLRKQECLKVHHLIKCLELVVIWYIAFLSGILGNDNFFILS